MSHQSLHRLVLDHAIRTKPPAHMRLIGKENRRQMINLEKLEAACDKRGVDVHDVIAEALKSEHREAVGHRQQAELAWKIVDKAVASKKAVELGGKDGEPLTIQIVKFADTP